MSFQEKKAIVSIGGTITIFTIYFILAYQRYLGLNLSPVELLTFWAGVLFISLPVNLFPKFIIHIIFSIINKLATNEDEPRFTDEMDRLIFLKMMKNAYFSFIAGFFLALATIFIWHSISLVFIIFLFALNASCVIADLTALYFYRRGF